MRRVHFELAETAVTIVADEEFISIGRDAIFQAREEIECYIRGDPWFLSTMESYPPPDGVPTLIRRMCEASVAAEVGPMAAVAGTIAEAAVKAMIKAGAEQAIVDNGGDIALRLKDEVRIGLYAGSGKFRDLALLLPPRREVHGICSSSGTVGPSISFGNADLATVISSNVSLADACATLLGNLIVREDESELRAALDRVCSIPGVDGAMAIIGEKMGMKGNMPRLVRGSDSLDRIARIEHLN